MKLPRLVVAIGPPLLAAVVGSVGSRRAPQVYRRLLKPAWAPPSGSFGPVWTALYAMIGVAGWRMTTRGAPPWAWALHAAQLTLNAAWPWAFFDIRDKRTSLAVIAPLDVLVTAEVIWLVRRDRLAAACLAPYWGWSLFATALNARVSEPDEKA